jgi:DNA-binding GntR family transcriptional regulator
VTLTFQPGQQLQESYLALWLGTSRTPVREALRTLQREGLVENTSSRSFVVAQLSVEDVEHAYRVIEMLEGLSSRMAAERINDQQAGVVAGLLGALRRAAEAEDLDRWVQADGAFHDQIRALAGNPKLSQMAGLVFPIVERVRNLYLRDGTDPDRVSQITAQHCDLGQAIMAGDVDQAELIARRLFAEAGQDNVRLLRQWVTPLRRNF